jgi:hypothetical protein
MDLRVPNVDPKLMARLKAEAALAGMSQAEFVIAWIKTLPKRAAAVTRKREQH